MELLVKGLLLNRYRILDKLGEGGFATVYKAYDQSLDRDVALKMIKTSLGQDGAGRFEREAKLLSQIKHKNVISVLAYHCEAPIPPFIVLEYLEGTTLRSVLNEKTKLDSKTIYQIVLQICEGLSYAHKLGLVHRDLSAANVFLETSNTDRLHGSKTEESSKDKTPQPGAIVKIIDFGLSRLFAGDLNAVKTLTETGMLVGNPHYMSPEAIKGAAQDNRSDIYSLGCILYECLTGKPVVEAENATHLFYFHEHSYPNEPIIAKNDQLAEILCSITLRCIQKDPAKRFQSCDEIIDSLQNRQNTKQLKAWTELDPWASPASEKRSQNTKFKVAQALIAVTVLAVVISAFVFFDQVLAGLAKASNLFSGSPEFEKSIAKTLSQHHRPDLARDILNQVCTKYLSKSETKNAFDCMILLAKSSLERNDRENFLQDVSRAINIAEIEKNEKKKVQFISSLSPSMDQGRNQLNIAKEILPLQQKAFGILLDNRKFVRAAVLKSSFDSLLQTATTSPEGPILGDPHSFVNQICAYLLKAKPRLDLTDHGKLNSLSYTNKIPFSEVVRLSDCRCKASPFTNEKISALWLDLAQRTFLLSTTTSTEVVDKAWEVAQKDPRADDGTFRGVREKQADFAIRNGKFDLALFYCSQAAQYADTHKDLVFIEARKLLCYFLKKDQANLARASNELMVSVMGGTKAEPGLPASEYPADFFEGEKGEERFFEYAELAQTLVKTQQMDKAKLVLLKLKDIVSYQKFQITTADKAQLQLFTIIATPKDIMKMVDEIVN